MKTISTFILLLFLTNVYAQEEFSFQLMFIDNAGNSDTLTLGYDPEASELIDENFGEINIANQSWNDTFEVRVTNANTRTPYDTVFSPTIECKKQIVKYNCEETHQVGGQRIYIDVKCNNWPVAITWDSTLFFENCVNNTGISLTEIADGAWNLANLSYWNTYDYPNGRPYEFYITTSGDTIHTTYWVAFFDWSNKIESLKINTQNVSVSPNPASDVINISFSAELSQDDINADIYNSTGTKIETRTKIKGDTKIDISNYIEGIYYVMIYDNKEVYTTLRVIKN